MWFKFRENWACGKMRWKYVWYDFKGFKGYKEWLRDYIEHEHNINTGSDTYRGLDVKGVVTVPKQVLEEKIESVKEEIKNLRKQLKKLEGGQ